jgi:hypothetical protein
MVPSCHLAETSSEINWVMIFQYTFLSIVHLEKRGPTHVDERKHAIPLFLRMQGQFLENTGMLSNPDSTVLAVPVVA